MTMQPHNCRSCGLAVTVEKFSAAHTSIQWLPESEGCPFVGARGRSLAERSCPELRRSIDEAVRDRSLVESEIELPAGSDIPRIAASARS